MSPNRKPPWPWPVSKCENFDLFFSIEFVFFDTQITFYLVVRGLKNALFMSSTPPIYRYPWILWQSNSKQKGRIGDNRSWMKMTFFLCKICFRTHTVPSGYPNPTRYPIFLTIPDPTRISFGNHRVAGNPKHWVLPDISGKPKVSGTTRYSGYHP